MDQGESLLRPGAIAHAGSASVKLGFACPDLTEFENGSTLLASVEVEVQIRFKESTKAIALTLLNLVAFGFSVKLWRQWQDLVQGRLLVLGLTSIMATTLATVYCAAWWELKALWIERLIGRSSTVRFLGRGEQDV